MVMNNTVAIIMSVYHKEKITFLRQAVDSMLHQTYDNIVIYLGVDGPVGDELKECITEYEKQNDTINVFWFEKNRGLAYVLNDLLDICFKNGIKFIARMDTDDISLLDRINKQVLYLESNEDIDVVGGAINEIDEFGNDLNKKVIFPESSKACLKYFAKRNPFCHPSVMFRRSFFDKAGCLYPTEYIRNEDTALWLEGFKHGIQGANLTDVILNFRVTNTMFSQRRNGFSFAKNQLHLRKRIIKEMNFGFWSRIYAYLIFFLMIMPPRVIKIAYKVLG